MDRKDFSEILYSSVIPEGTPFEEIKTKTQPIRDAIRQMLPSSLFRFRAYTNLSKNAFKDDVIYAVTADKFNDPFDTLAGYDIEGIKKGVNFIMDADALTHLKSWFEDGKDLPDILKQTIPENLCKNLREIILAVEDYNLIKERIEEQKKQLMLQIQTFFPIISEFTKKMSTVACFCESVQSVLMWSHYANLHTGFALEYDFRPLLDSPIKNVGIYPVLYEKERRDFSSYFAWAFFLINGIRINNPDISSSIKYALSKYVAWEYEKEWRLIDYTSRYFDDTKPSAISYSPVAIYYGQHMKRRNRSILHKIAQEKGIREYEMYIDYSSPAFEMKYRPALFGK